MEKINIEIAYIKPKQQTLLRCTVNTPCTALAAITQSGILIQHPEIDLTQQPIGIFGHKISLDTLIKEGDRIEIYRPLPMDPKKARKLRSSK